jgi:hypothetical protein
MMTAMKYVFISHFSPVAQYCTRKHLDELKYPAPRTVSKLVDQVGALTVIRLSALPNFGLRSFYFELGDIEIVFTNTTIGYTCCQSESNCSIVL